MYWYWYLSSTQCEFDPDTAYVVCISVSLGFLYMVSVFPRFPDMVFIFPCFPYMIKVPKHLNVKAIILDMALLWAARLHCPKDRYCDVTMIRLLLFQGIRADLSGIPGAVIVYRQSINYLLDFKVICWIFLWNNSIHTYIYIYIYIIGRNCRLGPSFLFVDVLTS